MEQDFYSGKDLITEYSCFHGSKYNQICGAMSTQLLSIEKTLGYCKATLDKNRRIAWFSYKGIDAKIYEPLKKVNEGMGVGWKLIIKCGQHAAIILDRCAASI